MCAVVLTHNPMRNIKQRISMAALVLAIVASVLTLINLINLILMYTSEYYDYDYFFDFFYGYGTMIAFGIISFLCYIALLGCFLVFGVSLFKLTDLSFNNSDRARNGGIFIVIAACFEGVGLFTNAFEFFDYVGIGSFIILIATILYIVGFIIIYQIFENMEKSNIITKKMTPTVIVATILYFAKTLTTIIIVLSDSVEYFTFATINSSLSLAYFGTLTAGMFLVYNSINSLDEQTSQKFFKQTGQPVYQPYIQPMYAPPPQQVVQYQPEQTRYCHNCGAKINPKDAFCSNCGTTLKDG